MRAVRDIRLILENDEKPVITAYSHCDEVCLHYSIGDEAFGLQLRPCEKHIEAVTEFLGHLKERYERKQAAFRLLDQAKETVGDLST